MSAPTNRWLLLYWNDYGNEWYECKDCTEEEVRAWVRDSGNSGYSLIPLDKPLVRLDPWTGNERPTSAS